jgi:hypothetical protein
MISAIVGYRANGATLADASAVTRNAGLLDLAPSEG